MNGHRSLQTILAAGLNPAWQKTLCFGNLRKGSVNRAQSMSELPSGKGINFCRAAAEWGKAETLLFQFTGGLTGKLIRDGLELEGIAHVSIPVSGTTRTCTTLIDKEETSMTELIEPSAEISPEEEDALVIAILKELDKAAGLAICGSYPPGLRKKEFTETILRKAAGLKIPVMADLWQNTDEILTEAVSILKINREELAAISGLAEIKDGAAYCFRKYPGLKLAGITDGPSTAYLAERSALSYFKIPEIEKAINPLGAGDTASAVFFSELLTGKEPEEAFADGLAAASASCMQLVPASFRKEDAIRIRKQITIISG